MDVQELLNVIEGIKGNSLLGVIIALYYLLINWSKIINGLGLLKKNKIDLVKIEKNYELLKLRIEIEKLKANSDLDNSILVKLENEMQLRLSENKPKEFTFIQKIVAIPLIILIFLQSMNELFFMNKNSEDTFNILFGCVLFISVVIIGFWGIPKLVNMENKIYKKICFILFWTFAFSLIAYCIAFIIHWNIVSKSLPGRIELIIIFTTFLICIVLGLINKLPLMNIKNTSNKVQIKDSVELIVK